MSTSQFVTGGTLNLDNGGVVSFSISEEYGWQQWGAVRTEDLYATMPLVTAITEFALEHGLIETDDDEGEDE